MAELILKTTTQNIQNYISQKVLSSEGIESIQINATKYQWSEIIGDSSISEVQVKLQKIVNFLSKFKNLVIVNQYSQTKRNDLQNLLSNIVNHLPGLAEGNNHLGNILSWTDTVYDIIYPDLVASKELGDYKQEMAILGELQKSYMSTSGQIEKLLKNKDKVEEFSNIINEVQTKLETSEASYQRIEKIQEEVEAKKLSINTFAGEIDTYKSIQEKTEKNYTDLSTKNQNETKELIQTNQELQKKVFDYLSDVIGGKSSEQLTKRADQINPLYWLIALALSLIVMVMVGYWIQIHLIEPLLTDPTKIHGIWEIALRYLILSPLIFLDIFFLTQFLYTKRLKEEYKFRAIIAGTLDTYIKLLSENARWAENKEFIISTADKIFESPIHKEEGMKLSDLKDISKQAISKTIEKIGA